MEAHLVHFNSKYGGIQEAAGHLDGLSIISLLFTVRAHNIYNLVLNAVASNLIAAEMCLLL